VTVVEYVKKLLPVSYVVESGRERIHGALVGRGGEQHDIDHLFVKVHMIGYV
jgi:hypothetical protein